MLMQMCMDRVVVLSSFQQLTDVSKASCLELWSLGVHLHELKASVTKGFFCKALLQCSPSLWSTGKKPPAHVLNNSEFYYLPCPHTSYDPWGKYHSLVITKDYQWQRQCEGSELPLLEAELVETGAWPQGAASLHCTLTASLQILPLPLKH